MEWQQPIQPPHFPNNRRTMQIPAFKELSSVTPGLEQSSEIFSQEQLFGQYAGQSMIRRKSSTHRQHRPDRQNTQSQLGSQWARWDVNRLSIQPQFLYQETQQLEIPRRARKRVSKSQEKQSLKLEREKEDEPKVSKRQHEERQREQMARRRRIMTEVLAGKGSFIWVFILGDTIEELELEPIYDLYERHRDNEYASSLCRTFEQAKRFFNLQNHYFKVISDLANAREVVQFAETNTNIVAIHIYASPTQNTSEIFELKRQSRKVKNAYMSLVDVAREVADDLLEEARFFDQNGQLQRVSKPHYRFPAFFVLSGNDSSEVTAYRLFLYGLLKLNDQTQRQQYLEQFLELVAARYANDSKQLRHLEIYKQIETLDPNSRQKAETILKFYVKQNFYFATVNSLLRLSRSSDEFKPCTVPFNETYHAIKYYHSLRTPKNKFRAYRGTKLKISEVNSLAIGSYIELLGFTSSSLSRDVALRFMDQDSYLVVIEVDQDEAQKEDEKYCHGYVDINKYELAKESFHQEQQILFNALNVFRVTAIDNQSAIRTIVLKYGALKELYKKEFKSLTLQQQTLIQNFEYCTSILNKIEDNGDVLLLAQEHDKAKKYYLNKLEKQEQDQRIHNKLANIQLELGNLPEAESHALALLNALSNSNEHTALNSQQFYKTSETAANILLASENVDAYEKVVDLQVSKATDFVRQVNPLVNRANSRVRRGEQQGSLNDLLRADETLESKKQSFKARRKQIESNFFWKGLFACLKREDIELMEEERDAELLKIDQEQIDFQARQQQYYDLKIKIEKVRQECYGKKGDKTKSEDSQKKMKEYFKQLAEKDEDLTPINAAIYYSTEALTVKNTSFQQYEQLMQTSIQLIREVDPYHEQMATISQQLATERHLRLMNRLNLTQPVIESTSARQKKTVQHFSYEDHRSIYKSCRGSYREAIDSIVLHKGKEHPECLRVQNKLAQLDMDYSLLKLAEEESLSVTKRKVAESHSEGAKSFLLLAKIGLARGQLKRAFNMIEKANAVLSVCMGSRGKQSYILKHPLFAQINLCKTKVFNHQMRHDLALQQLDLLSKAINTSGSLELLPTIMQERAEILFCQGALVNFQQFILKAIEARTKIMGKYNIQNAVSYQKLSMFARLLGDYKDACAFHAKAVQIFSIFSVHHPISWIMHLSNAALFIKEKTKPAIRQELLQCLNIAQKRYSKDHICLMKIQLTIGKLLLEMGLTRQGLQLYETVNRNLQQQINVSAMLEDIRGQFDDEKLSIQSSLNQQMEELRSRRKIMDGPINVSKELLEVKLRRQYINSLTSLNYLS